MTKRRRRATVTRALTHTHTRAHESSLQASCVSVTPVASPDAAACAMLFLSLYPSFVRRSHDSTERQRRRVRASQAERASRRRRRAPVYYYYSTQVSCCSQERAARCRGRPRLLARGPAPRSLALEANAVKSVAVADIIFALESTRRVGLRLRAWIEGASGSERDFKADSVHVYPRRARETRRQTPCAQLRHRAARREGGKVR